MKTAFATPDREASGHDDPLAELRAALRRHSEATAAFDAFQPRLKAAWHNFDQQLIVPRRNGDLAECLELNSRRGVPSKDEKPAFNADLAAAQEAQKESNELSRAVGDAERELETIVSPLVSELAGRISEKKQAIIEEVVRCLTPHVQYPSDAASYARNLYSVRGLDNSVSYLGTSRPLTQARLVLSDWEKYAPKN